MSSNLDSAHQAYREKYVEACTERHSEILKKSRDRILQQRLLVETLQAQLIAEIRAAAFEDRKVRELPAINRESAAREFDAILELPKVRRVSVEPGALNVYTDTLYASDPHSQTRHEIGRFKIKIYLDGQSDGVRWYNLDRQVPACTNNQQSPQVLKSGRACICDIKDILPDLIAEMQFSIVVQISIDFIEQMNAEDLTTAYIKQWPTV